MARHSSLNKMPATEETYRRQPTLHIVFAVTSIGMLLATVWMILADHLRPWKEVQREFQQVETAKLRAQEKQKLEEQRAKSQAELDEIDRRIVEADQTAERNGAEIRAKEREIDKARGT